MNWNYMQPVTIHFGEGKIAELGEEIKKLGAKKGLLVCDPVFVGNGTADRVKEAAKGLIAVTYADVQPNPDVAQVEDCLKLIHEYHCDFIVALGGGSVLDAAKAASVMCMKDIPVRCYLTNASLLPESHLPLIAVPTTAGTGSEITSVSVLSDHETGIKQPLASPAFYPTLAIVDPELTWSVPPHMTACTGMDVLCHALEAYWSRHHQPICDALAVHALKLVFQYLKRCVEDGADHEAREKMAEASVIAGLAFTVPKTTSSHACSYPLTNLLHIAHGEACALTIDFFLRFNAGYDDGRLMDLAQALGFEDPMDMADGISFLKHDIGIMEDLKAFAIDDTMYEALVQGSKHPNLLNNPVEVPDSILRELYSTLR